MDPEWKVSYAGSRRIGLVDCYRVLGYRALHERRQLHGGIVECFLLWCGLVNTRGRQRQRGEGGVCGVDWTQQAGEGTGKEGGGGSGGKGICLVRGVVKLKEA